MAGVSKLSEAQGFAIGAGVGAAGGGAGYLAGRRRGKAGKGRPNRLFRGGTYDLGYKHGSKKVSKAGFANRDQNSSIGATTTLRKPVGPGKRPTLAARSGHHAGKTRGVGRKESRDANSSPRVTRVQPRHPNGKFVSHENDLQVFHPDGNKYRSRQPKSSALGIHRKDSGHVSRVYSGKKSEQTTFGKAQSLVYGRGNTRFGGTGTRGRKLS